MSAVVFQTNDYNDEPEKDIGMRWGEMYWLKIYLGGRIEQILYLELWPPTYSELWANI